MSKKITLLYVEYDSQAELSCLDFIRNRYSFEVCEVQTTKEALTLFSCYYHDIVIVNTDIPNTLGLELVQKIRKHSKNTKVIIFSADSNKENLLNALKLNLLDYILKPVNTLELQKSIDTAVETLCTTKQHQRFIHFNATSYFNTQTYEYFYENGIVTLSYAEQKLLALLCSYPNKQFTALDISLEVYSEKDREFSATSIRTLIKNLRQKLPKDVLVNIYGGFYKLCLPAV